MRGFFQVMFWVNVPVPVIAAWEGSSLSAVSYLAMLFFIHHTLRTR